MDCNRQCDSVTLCIYRESGKGDTFNTISCQISQQCVLYLCYITLYTPLATYTRNFNRIGRSNHGALPLLIKKNYDYVTVDLNSRGTCPSLSR